LELNVKYCKEEDDKHDGVERGQQTNNKRLIWVSRCGEVH